ncbi:MAG: slipin family protein [Candidatus Heimdallarchaeota archaeon]|nr:slipin family protein [Candidatus Heimdallarchaeota archaeon]MDH5647663.1 slipin family protein [Candidatus Heimdallarchaeota archaeon]
MSSHYGILIFLLFIILIIFISGIRLVKEYERVVIFRLGRFNGVKGPGLFWIIPYLDKSIKVDLRTQVIDVPRQEAITKDNVPAVVNAAVFYQINEPAKAIIRVENYRYAISQIAQTTLRSVIGAVDLDELLSNRAKVNAEILTLLDEASDAWGVDVSKVELKDLELPDNMKRAMAKQAESERERRSRIILAEGELEASKKLSEAAKMMSEHGGVTLRLLQTIQEISTENTSTVIIPFPADLTGAVSRMLHQNSKSLPSKED